MAEFYQALPGARQILAHPLRMLLLLLWLAAAPVASPLLAQSAYRAQVDVIEEMIQKGQWRLARLQSTALIEAGRDQQLPDVEAYGHYLYGRTLLEAPGLQRADRIEGIRELRAASDGFTDTGLTATVDSIVERMRAIAGAEPTTVDPLPNVNTLRGAAPARVPISEEDLDETALNAIVALQNQEIEALTDSQLRQLLRIQQQDLAIDSFQFHALTDSLQLMRQEMLLEEQRSLTTEERQRRNFFILLALGVLVALGLLYYRYRSAQRFQTEIREAQERTDELLLNILPKKVALELQDTGRATARRYESASVLFTDFVGFSRIAHAHDPEELVRMLDLTFRAFDDITERHGLEKIKTIGDAYMCVGGVPEEDPDHAEHTVRAALEIQEYLAQSGEFTARIGIHSGPVVAGVVGRKKFAFDIWGDTVNQAARLEAAGTAGEVTVSQATCDLLSPQFNCEEIGTFDAKNMGTLLRYRVRDSRLMKKPS